MGRIRELLAHGGIAILAVVFALAFAAFNLAASVSSQFISVLQQHFAGEDGTGFISFTVLGTRIDYVEALYHAIVVVLLGACLFAVWRLTRNETRTCGDCRSRVPTDATVCRFCTSEFTPIADA